MWVGTFHGIAHRLLRLHWREAEPAAELPDPRRRGSAAADQEDPQGAGARRGALGAARDPVVHQSQQGRGPASAHAQGRRRPDAPPADQALRGVRSTCQRAGVVDFAELLLRAYELWRDNAGVLAHYRQRFRHVLVDEFQDTNAIQYAWCAAGAGQDGAPFVVGDDDQSIYRWRGARVENLTRFQRITRTRSCAAWSRTTAPPATSSRPRTR